MKTRHGHLTRRQLESAYDKAINALAVIILSDGSLNYLAVNDPCALWQARNAVPIYAISDPRAIAKLSPASVAPIPEHCVAASDLRAS